MPVLSSKLQSSVSSLHRPAISPYLTLFLVTPYFDIGEHAKPVSNQVHRLRLYDQVNAAEGAMPVNDVLKQRRSVPDRYHANCVWISDSLVAWLQQQL